jgi:hypothetical protein
MARKIVLMARGNHVFQTEDKPAGGAITPGMVLALNSSGQLIAHNVAGGVTSMVAMERDEMGKDIDAAYASGDRVKCAHLSSGERFNGLLETGANVAIGALLESNGAGALQPVTAGTAIVQALEALNNASGSNQRIRVQVL